MERRAKNNRTVVDGEGDDEVGFLEYLREVYSSDITNPKIVPCGGGNPKNVVQNLRNTVAQIGAFDRRYVLLDHDVSQEKMESGESETNKRPKIDIVYANNRFEVEMLKILDAPSESTGAAMSPNSNVAKDELAKICDKSFSSYCKLLPKKILDKQRKKNGWLDKCIKIMEG